MDEQKRLELDELHARIVKMGAETAKLNAEVVKLGTENLKLNTENNWYPFAAGAAFFAVVLALVKLLL